MYVNGGHGDRGHGHGGLNDGERHGEGIKDQGMMAIYGRRSTLSGWPGDPIH